MLCSYRWLKLKVLAIGHNSSDTTRCICFSGLVLLWRNGSFVIILILAFICSCRLQKNVAVGNTKPGSPCCNKLFMITAVEEGLFPHIYHRHRKDGGERQFIHWFAPHFCWWFTVTLGRSHGDCSVVCSWCIIAAASGLPAILSVCPAVLPMALKGMGGVTSGMGGVTSGMGPC